MNKEKFVEKLSKQASLTKEEAILVNDIFENNFFISKKYKDKIISEIVLSLNININEATNIYEIAKDIISSEIKNKIKHPFGN